MRLYPDDSKVYADGCPVCGSMHGECTTDWRGPTNLPARMTCYQCGCESGAHMNYHLDPRPLGPLEKLVVDNIDVALWAKTNPLLSLLFPR